MLLSNQQSKASSPNASNNNPFLNNSPANSAPVQSSIPTVDLLESDPVLHTSSNKASEDLLQLGNPFVDAFAPVNPPVATQPNNLWLANGNSKYTIYVRMLLNLILVLSSMLYCTNFGAQRGADVCFWMICFFATLSDPHR